MTTKYGIIGCGMMGIEHIKNIQLLEGTEVAAIYEPNAEQRAHAKALVPDAKVAQTLTQLINREELDALVIASPNHLHVPQLETISFRRTIPILCEKPLYTRPEDEAAITKIQSKYRAPIWVAMEYRYMPPITALIEQADAVTGGINMLTLQEHRFPFLEKIGDWNRFNANTGGTFVEKCCHFFDLMRLIMGCEPTSVIASATQFNNHLDELYDGQTPDIWDGGYVVFDFENGSKALLELCMFADGSKWNETIHAIGSKGKIECRIPGPQRFWPEDRLGPSPHPELSIYPRFPKAPTTKVIDLDPALLAAGDHHGSTFYQHQKFLEMVRAGDTQPDVSLEDGKRAVKMGLAAQKAAATNSVVYLTDTADTE